VSYRLVPPETPLRAYAAPVLRIDCARCRRNAPDVQVAKLIQRFGADTPIAEVARQITLNSAKPCGLAESGHCNARAWEPPVWMWASLDHALKGKWLARLRCRRHIAAMKATTSCPEVVLLDVETLHSAFGYDFKLEALRTRMSCPRCHTRVVEIEWIVPEPTPDPYAPAAAEPPLRFRPTRAAQGRAKFRIVEGK
jgi:hypothetical protein